MKFSDPIFVNPKNLIQDDADVVFVSDLFVEDYVGGAELTSEALISSSPFRVQKLHSKDVDLGTLAKGASKFWIFGNFAQLNPSLIPSVVANLNYSVLEYDYKYCRYRSAEKHAFVEGKECDCQNQMSGKLVSAFYHGAKCMWWMSEAQKDKYTKLFPFLVDKDNIVLSSVFDKKTLGALKWLKDKVDASKQPRSKWIVLGSDSWVKGADAAKKWCEDNKKDYEVVWGVSYDDMLNKLAHAEGFVYLPAGADTCPRMVIEAKLLGCQLHLNDYVQHAKEEWFATDSLQDISDYLYSSPESFWRVIRHVMEKKPSISGYITTYNCEKQGYPYDRSIRSMLQFCEEVCVVDGGSTDGTPETLLDLQMKNSPEDVRVKLVEDLKREHGETLPISVLHEALNGVSRVKVKTVSRDWTHPRHAVFDGMQKAEARKMCTGDFCWQMDSDEVVHEDDATKIVDLCSKIPRDCDILALPVVEYWGGPDKVRIDIQPWKWRLSRNKTNITHGIPVELRATDVNGDVYAVGGTDGCDMIDAVSGKRINHLTFHNGESESTRIAAVSGDEKAIEAYSTWFNRVIRDLPGVHHYSWYDIPRKMRLYRDYWTRHWNSLYNKSLEDTAETNMMFDIPWSEVTEEMIEKRALELKECTGGWIWHRKWTGERVPHITVDVKEPSL